MKVNDYVNYNIMIEVLSYDLIRAFDFHVQCVMYTFKSFWQHFFILISCASYNNMNNIDVLSLSDLSNVYFLRNYITLITGDL